VPDSEARPVTKGRQDDPAQAARTDSDREKPGDKTPQYCHDCAAERIFQWATWSGGAFYGYPALPECGRECSSCGNRLRVPAPSPDGPWREAAPPIT